MDSLRVYWGKAGKKDDESSVHPALFHMIDTAQVASVWMKQAKLEPLVREWNLLLGGDAPWTKRFLAFLAGMHDIGKISPGFQAKRKDLIEPLRSIHDFGMDVETDHGFTGYAALIPLFSEIVSKRIAKDLAQATAAHHGRFYILNCQPGKNPLDKEKPAKKSGYSTWSCARKEVWTCMSTLFGVDLERLHPSEDEFPSEAVMKLSGFISICDWIASSTDHFPYVTVPLPSVEEYFRQTEKLAELAIQKVGLNGSEIGPGAIDYDSLFGIQTPHDMQRLVEERMAEASLPSLVLVEVPMGGGKTEAALHAAFSWLQHGDASGVYVALPTQATSNQMFCRVQAVLERRYGKRGATAELHLLHGLSDLNPNYQALKVRGIEGEPEETVLAHSWFMAKKRALLADFGVGTIDQSLLAALKTRHVSVRLFALSGKVVIFDEVHAYDMFMSEILGRLLRWLKALGARVVLLSATLPLDKRREMLAAFGADVENEPQGLVYPRLTYVNTDGKTEVVGIPPGPSRTFHVERLEATVDLRSEILERISSGGVVAYLCNTVQTAQQAFKDLKQAVPDDVDLLLFHARFPLHHRLEIEQRCLRLFGKNGNDRPRKAVLVATQVIEQSLDLDFDWMISEIAPVDLLLQRMGRLHRHKRQRPEAFGTPVFSTIAPSFDENGLPTFGVNEYVYDRYTLLRTWKRWQALNEVKLPDDLSPLVEAVYGEEPEIQDAAWTQALEQALADFEKDAGKDRQKAWNQLLPLPEDNPHKGMDRSLDDEDSSGGQDHFHAMTRLAEPSVTLVCLERQADGTFLLQDGTAYDPTQPLTPNLVRSLRLSSVTVQKFKAERHILSQLPDTLASLPKLWEKIGALRDCRPAVFENEFLVEEMSKPQSGKVRLSPELGLRFTKEGEDDADV